MLTPLRLTRRLCSLSWHLAALYLFTATASAETPPASVYGMAYATVDENTLYVQGGIVLPLPGGSAKLSNQFYSLDLTQEWNTTSPPWKALPSPPQLTQVTSQSMTVSPNRQTLTIWSINPTLAVNYSLSGAPSSPSSWTQVPLSVGLIVSGAGLQAATDPTTGLVHIPGAGPFNNNYMVRYNFMTGLSTLISIPLTLVSALDSYAFVWCQPRRTFLLFAGNVSSVNSFFEFSPSMSQWSRLVTSGLAPTFRRRSCMVPAYNGTKMILFGGDGSGPSVASISILDVTTMTWTNGKDAPDARSEMACSVSGDNFIVWGGYKEMVSVENVGVPVKPLIYNIKTGLWMEKFVRNPNGGNKTDGAPGSGSGTAPGGGSGAGSGGGSGSGSGGGSTGGGVGPVAGGGQIVGDNDVIEGEGSTTNGAAIGGGIAGAMAVIAGIAFFTIQRRHRQRNTRDFEMVSPNMSMLPSTENRGSRPTSSDYYQNKFNQQQQQDIQYTTGTEPQGDIGSPPSYSASSRSRPAIPSYYDVTGISSDDPRDLIRQLPR